MASVADLAEEKHLRELAASDVLDAGTKLAEEGTVSLGKFGPLEVAASVEEGAETYEVQLLGGEELRWSCTCPQGQSGSFCKHCVAVARETWLRSPARRTGND
jgi:uncharacterized Zn finger protein